MTFASAASRIAQVLITTRSAASIDGASAQPAASSRPAISSESLLFIWQPSVQTKNDGQGARLGPELARGARRRGRTASRGPAGRDGRRRDVEDGEAAVVMTLVMVVPVVVPARESGPCPIPSVTWNWITSPEAWIALLTLTVLEIVLGIDNVVFISVLVQRLPRRAA